MTQQPAIPAVAQTPTTHSVKQPAIPAVAQIPATPTNDAPVAIQEEDQGIVSGIVSTPASMLTVAPGSMTANPNGTPDEDDGNEDEDEDGDNDDINSSNDPSDNGGIKVQLSQLKNSQLHSNVLRDEGNVQLLPCENPLLDKYFCPSLFQGSI